jgi:hypothetical protein
MSKLSSHTPTSVIAIGKWHSKGQSHPEASPNQVQSLSSTKSRSIPRIAPIVVAKVLGNGAVGVLIPSSTEVGPHMGRPVPAGLPPLTLGVAETASFQPIIVVPLDISMGCHIMSVSRSAIPNSGKPW